MFKTDSENLKKHLQDELYIENNSFIWLHSGLKGLGLLSDGLQTITDTFSTVLSDGALVIPSFSYSWNKGEEFNPLVTECPEMGGYAKMAWKDSRFKRNLNPNFSVSVMDNTQDSKIESTLFSPDTRYSCFGEKSSFSSMLKLASEGLPGYILLFGGAHDDVIFRTTFLHMIEESIGVPYRYIKEFKDPAGSDKTISQSVRFLSSAEFLEINGFAAPGKMNFPIQTNYSLLGEDMIKEKLLKIVKFGYSESRIVSIKHFCLWLEAKITDDPEYLLK